MCNTWYFILNQNCRVKANFGSRPFAYAEGQQHRDAAEAANDVIRDIRESFGHLPFHCVSDSDSDGNEAGLGSSMAENRDNKTPPRAPCKTAVAPQALRGETPFFKKCNPLYTTTIPIVLLRERCTYLFGA